MSAETCLGRWGIEGLGFNCARLRVFSGSVHAVCGLQDIGLQVLWYSVLFEEQCEPDK